MAADETFPIASYCSSQAWGGLEMNVLRFLHWMRGRGWPAVLFARPGSPLLTWAAAWGLPARALQSRSKASDLLGARTLARMAAADSARVLILHQSRDLLMAVLTKIHTGNRLKVVYQQHMHIAGDKRDLLHAWQYRRLDAFVAPAPSLARQVAERTPIRPERLHVIPLGLEADRFLRKPPRSQARRQLGLPLDVPLAGIIGRLDPKKGQHVAIKALRRVHETGRPLHLLVVGAPTRGEHADYEAHLHRLADDLGLAPFVHFRSHLDEPATAYAAMDIFILASQSETYGMVTIEAMASELAVAGTDAGGTVDLIAHERNGLRFPPGDESACAAAVIRFLADPHFAGRMAAQARRDVLANFTHDRQCAQWETLLRGLAGAAPAGSK
ncbi:MAG TPA: glycosyltransferase family 4 protein [candidate division Zixibacteria bacterium]|nr:glycosyltransferase family 4 protein [candidate division Zixibacteria bacterium]MDD4917990.1 glycosyltransferase family 4 protein [candidate division Zixibacteria bacterium]MDM7972458.1 glycosyltransferase family 4 protein [candidate division Zixibacteria bacterium]HOD66534.1 glycosyltransferase family 4 protein [candidate division Zixibacteria bacterium]HOZ07770.1 glycosyltransferase family 4 protein [candidate division Zixibacteria bacterium]